MTYKLHIKIYEWNFVLFSSYVRYKFDLHIAQFRQSQFVPPRRLINQNTVRWYEIWDADIVQYLLILYISVSQTFFVEELQR
jgi:hypothetical protein